MSKEHGGIVKAWELVVRKSQAIGAAKRKVNGIFPAMSVAHVDDDDDGFSCDDNAASGEIYHAEKLLSNGDFYTGQWADNVPHRHGKYLWTDGCMYVGDWHRGKTNGRGKFCWPSGATYEGEFKKGYMDGKGTYTGPSGDTYKGSWAMNLKHGQGTKSYVNGDLYEGDWRNGSQDGHGRYQWRNGHHYDGQWKNGVIDGEGTMVWNNGNQYDGFWEGGLPKGDGIFTWEDGSSYVGVWSKDPEEQSGAYYPTGSVSVAGDPHFDPWEVFATHMADCIISPSEKVSILPSQKMLGVQPITEGELFQKQSHWKPLKGNDGRTRRMNNQGSDIDSDRNSDLTPRSMVDGIGSARLDGSDVRTMQTWQRAVRIQPVKKQGVPITKGHKNYELMLNLQLGIRHSAGKSVPAASLDLKSSAFDPKEKVWTRFPPEGSKHTPPHQSCEFRWKDYCPLVFRTLRKMFKVDAADYMISLCGNDALRELSSPGKSGSFFYLTHDDRYMIKTMKKAEVKVLLKMLPAYYKHVRSFENTLVTKFFGLHCVKLTGPAQKKVRFVVMGNLFCSEYTIHKRFDLKGSSYGRITTKPDSQIDATTTLKDLDLNFIFRLPKFWFQDFCRQVDKDCDFLEQEKIMDYSLLVGLHFREISYNKDSQSKEARPSRANGDSNGSNGRLSNAENLSRRASTKLGINTPARAELSLRRPDCETQLVGEPTGELYDVIIFFGIIDILQDYDISKKLEHAYKSIQHDSTSISAVDPKQYSRRFRDFVFRIFLEDA